MRWLSLVQLHAEYRAYRYSRGCFEIFRNHPSGFPENRVGTHPRPDLHAPDPEFVMDDLVFMLDASGRVAGWNDRASRITGHAAGEIIGRHVSALYGAEDAASALSRRALNRAVAEGVCEEKVRIRLADGTVFPAMMTATALRDAADNPIGFSVAMRDA